MVSFVAAQSCFQNGDFTDALTHIKSSLGAQTVKHLPAMQKTWVQSLGLEDPLEEGMETHFSILAWRIPMDRVHEITKSRIY